MPLLEEVINEFKSGFKYVDQSGRRNTRWYELWYLNASIKKQCTDEKLTTAIEQAVTHCNSDLETLAKDYGHENFASHRQGFFDIIAEVLHTVRVKRFVHGTVSTQNFFYSDKSIFERYLTPKEAGFFEDNLINGLNKVKNKYPELGIETIIEKINNSKQKSLVLCHESMRINAKGEKVYSTATPTDSKETREEFVDTQVSKPIF